MTIPIGDYNINKKQRGNDNNDIIVSDDYSSDTNELKHKNNVYKLPDICLKKLVRLSNTDKIFDSNLLVNMLKHRLDDTDVTEPFLDFLLKIFRYIFTTHKDPSEINQVHLLEMIHDAYISGNFYIYIEKDCGCTKKDTTYHHEHCANNPQTSSYMDIVLQKLSQWDTTSENNIYYLNELIVDINRLIKWVR